jgi:hypothetical protein
VIVVIGLPAYVAAEDGEGSAGGLAVDVAAAAQARGAAVELVGKIGDDGAGDAVVVALGRLGVGHAALLRDPARPTPLLAWLPVASEAETGEAETGEAETGEAETAAGEREGAWEPAAGELEPALLPADAAARPALDAADVELALRYVSGAKAVVVADPLAEAALAAAVEGATFSGARLVVLVASGTGTPKVPADATVLEIPPRDEGAFGQLVGLYAASLDRGLDPGLAFKEAVEASGWGAVQD